MSPELAVDEEPELELGSLSIWQQREFPLQPWEIQLLFWTGCIFSPQSRFESNNDVFLSPGRWEAAWGIHCREGLWEWLLPGSSRVPAVRRRRRPLLPLSLLPKAKKK